MLGGEQRAQPHEGPLFERAPERVALVAAARAFALLTLADGEPDAAALAALPEMAEINLYLADIEVLLAQLDALRRTLVEMSL